MAETNYATLDNAYNTQLTREPDRLNFVVGGGNFDTGTTEKTQNEAQAGGNTAASSNAGGGPAQQASVASEGAMADIVILNSIQSANWAPKKTGFYINGLTGYAEFTNVFVSGNINATTGDIGGFSIGADYIRDAADSMGLSSAVSGGDDVRFWAGDTFANRATAPFRVTEAGAITGSNFTITGGSIAGTSLSSVPNTTATDISLLGASHSLVFSVTDSDTIAWASGTINLSNGRSFSISSGNTGNMSALTYIYLDPGVSSTVLQTTTTFSTAIGANKRLIGTAQNNTVTASFIPFDGGQPLIDGANIGSLSIVAGNIAASTITAGKLSVSQLSAITADMGAITAGTITVSSSGYIRGGQTAYNTGSGFFLGYSSSAYKFSIGDGTASNSLTWDGTNLRVGNIVISGKGAFGGDGSDGALTITSGTTTVSLGSAQIFSKNYSSISITGTTSKLAFSSPATNGTIIQLKSQDAVTITSTNNPAIDASGMGASGAAASGSGNQTGGSGSSATSSIIPNTGGGGGGGTTGGSSGSAGSAGTASGFSSVAAVFGKYLKLSTGAGGGAGGSMTGDTGGSGAGGKGGGCLYIECAGALNVTSTITVAGVAGSTAAVAGNNGAGGGGGGGGGTVIILYNSLTADSSTLTVSGGAGGTGATGSGSYTGAGGGGGGSSIYTAGSAGSAGGGNAGGAGGAGASGFSLVAQNTEFA